MIEILLVAIEDGGALPHAWLLIGLALLFGLFMLEDSLGYEVKLIPCRP